jgi:anti-anti-sigma factor
MTAPQIRSKMVEGVAVIYPGPYLNQLRGEIMERQCQDLVSQGVRRIIINFADTELINSIGISILLSVIETVNEDRGSLVLTHLNSTNRELFEMLGLLSHVEIEETEDSALLKLCGQLA